MSLEHLKDNSSYVKLCLQVLSHTTIITCWSPIQVRQIRTYIAFQNENGVCLTIIINKRQLTMIYGGRNCKRHSLQAGTLKNCDE
jgi:hypothetical protein